MARRGRPGAAPAPAGPGTAAVPALVRTAALTTLAVLLASCSGADPVTFGPAGPPSTVADAAGASGGATGAAVGGRVTASPHAPADAAGLLPAIPGRQGSAGRGWDVPPVPEIVVPDVTVVDVTSGMLGAQIGDVVDPVRGVTVTGAVCRNGVLVTRAGANFGAGSVVIDRAGKVPAADGAATLGSAATTAGEAALGNPGTADGAGTGDGGAPLAGRGTSGTYAAGLVQLVNRGDGSGTYTDGRVRITIGRNGSGSYTDGTVRIVNRGDGSGSYADGTVSIVNRGDGSGTYSDGVIKITNVGNGQGTVGGGAPVPMDPLPPVTPTGSLPPMKALRSPGKDCGTLIRLADPVLFDADSTTLRPAAGPLLDAVARALSDRTGTVTVLGHTDSAGDGAANLTRSERRAAAVADALRSRGVTAQLTVRGLGAGQPLAHDSLGGEDRPGGRQLNRRIEIVVPGS